MFQYNKSFFDKALKDGVIVSNETTKTEEMIHAADLAWEKGLNEDPFLRAKIKEGSICPKHISEAIINETDHLGNLKERPIIDLVQQGGGMLGIALLGYTYIMEKVGIRFHSHGGASAGAINAAFLAAVPNSVYGQASIFAGNGSPCQATKSEVLTHIIANTDFSSFMERGGMVGYLQRNLIKNWKSWKVWLPVGLFITAYLAGVYFIFSLIIDAAHISSILEIRSYDFFIGTFNFVVLLLLIYFLFTKALHPRFGFNTGAVYYHWVDTFLHLFDIYNTKDLENRLAESVVITYENGTETRSEPRLVMIATELTRNKVVKLPKEAGNYWANPGNVNPAAYLRATMSIPVIYKMFMPQAMHYDVWEPSNEVKGVSKLADGGILSNFPIREFHRTDGKTPNFPTFGVMLSKRETESKEEVKNTFPRYLGSLIKTFRNFYDNDFLLNNEEARQLIEPVNTEKFNWLNFWMDDTEKKSLFVEGAKSAMAQLTKFDWQAYKGERQSGPI